MSSYKQSVMWWCFEHLNIPPKDLLRVIADTGYAGVEIFHTDLFPLVQSFGLEIVAFQAHVPLEDGLNKLENRERLTTMMTERIQLAAKWNTPYLICFSGNRNNLDDTTGAEVTAETLRGVAKLAEDSGVTLILETLNSKVDHPDYMADTTAWAVDVIKMVDSPAVKVLYDIYHMQVMEGDIIATIQANAPYIGHYHTAGCPGRHEIDDSQEIYYPAVMQAIDETGFSGYVGQEFIPLKDPFKSLQAAFNICNI